MDDQNLRNKRFPVGNIKEAGNGDRCTINHANHSSWEVTANGEGFKTLKDFYVNLGFYVEFFGAGIILLLCIRTVPGAGLQLASQTFITTQIVIKTEQNMHFVPAVNCPIKGKTK